MSEQSPVSTPPGAALLAAPVVGVRPRRSAKISLPPGFDLFGSQGEPLGSVVEQSAGGRWLLGNIAERHWLVQDAAGATIFLLHKPGAWTAQHFSIVDSAGQPVGELQQTHSALTWEFDLRAADGSTGRMHGQRLGGRHWTIEDSAGQQAGQVTDRFPTLAHLFTQPNTFVVELGSLGGDLRSTALVAGVCLEIIGAH